MQSGLTFHAAKKTMSASLSWHLKWVKVNQTGMNIELGHRAEFQEIIFNFISKKESLTLHMQEMYRLPPLNL